VGDVPFMDFVAADAYEDGGFMPTAQFEGNIKAERVVDCGGGDSG